MTDRRTTITLEVTDKFSQTLNNFAAGMDKSAESMKKVSTSATKLDEVGRKIEDAGKKAQSMSDRLQNAFGGSSRAVNTFGNAVGSAIGLSGEFGYTLDVLMDSGAQAALSFGAMTAGAAVLGVAINSVKQSVEDHIRSLKSEASALAQTNISAAQYLEATKELRTEQGLLSFAQDYVTKGAVAAGMAWADAQLNAEKYANATLRVGKMMHDYSAGVTEAIAKQGANATSTGEYAAAVLKLAEAFAPLNYAGKEFKDLTDAQKDAMISLAEGNIKYARYMSDAANVTVTFVDEGLRAIGVVDDIGAAMKRTGALIANSDYLKAGGGPTFEDMSLVDPSAWSSANEASRQDKAMKKMADDTEKAKANARAMASIVKQTQSQAYSLYKSLSEGSDKTSKQVAADFADTFVGIMQAEADLNNNTGLSMIQLQQVFGKAFDGMSQDMVGKLLGVMDAGGAMAQSLISQLYAIAAGGGTAAEQIEAIRAALAGLPTDKYINIHLNYKASGPGGNQQGDEWNFNLEGEAYGVRAAYMQKYGDYGRANDAWQADHRQELNDKGVTGPGQANTRTGEVYQYAYGEHSIVTSPRMMLVGERGPERVDITPGTGARGGSGGGSVTVNFNSLVPPNEFEVRQLAAKLKSYMRM